jgi:hypothetical protein
VKTLREDGRPDLLCKHLGAIFILKGKERFWRSFLTIFLFPVASTQLLFFLHLLGFLTIVQINLVFPHEYDLKDILYAEDTLH